MLSRNLVLRINNLKKLQSVIKAVQVLALSALQLLKKNIISRHYSLLITSLIVKDILLINTNILSIFIKATFIKKVLVILYMLDKSCCGSLNASILTMFKYLYTSITANNKLNSIFYITIGLKSFNFIKKKHSSTLQYSFFYIENESITLSTSYLLVASLKKTSHDLCLIIHNIFLDTFNQKSNYYAMPSLHFFFSYFLNAEVLETKIYNNIGVKTFMSSAFTLYLYDFLTCLLFLDILEEAEYCIHGARAKTMDSALNTIASLLTVLTVQYNKVRQATITNEIIEVLNCASSTELS